MLRDPPASRRPRTMTTVWTRSGCVRLGMPTEVRITEEWFTPPSLKVCGRGLGASRIVWPELSVGRAMMYPFPTPRSQRLTVCSRRRSRRWTRSPKPAPTPISWRFSPYASTRRAGSIAPPFPRWPRWSAAGCSPRRVTSRRPPPWRIFSAGPFQARRRVIAAERVSPRVGLNGFALPPRSPATAAMFTDGRASLRHVEAIARLLDTPSARRLSPEQWAGAESAVRRTRPRDYTPSQAAVLGRRR